MLVHRGRALRELDALRARFAGDHAAAVARCEALIARWARGCQSTARHMGPFFAPPTRAGLALRNTVYRALTSRALAVVPVRLTAGAASGRAVPAHA